MATTHLPQIAVPVGRTLTDSGRSGMSYDLSVECQHCGSKVWHRDPTYNLAAMFAAALGSSIRDLDGRPAHECVDRLAAAVSDMEAQPDYYKQFNPKNGWGNYDGALEILREMRDRCASNRSECLIVKVT